MKTDDEMAAVPPGIPPVLTVKEAAQLTRLSERYLYNLMRDGKLPCYRVGTSVRLNSKVLFDFLAEGGKRGKSEN